MTQRKLFRLQDLRIRTKLLLGFALVVVIAGLAGYVTISQFGAVAEVSSALTLLNPMAKNTQYMAHDVNAYLLAYPEHKQEFAEHSRDFERAWQGFQGHQADHGGAPPEEQPLMAQIDRAKTNYFAGAAQLFDWYDAQNKQWSEVDGWGDDLDQLTLELATQQGGDVQTAATRMGTLTQYMAHDVNAYLLGHVEHRAEFAEHNAEFEAVLATALAAAGPEITTEMTELQNTFALYEQGVLALLDNYDQVTAKSAEIDQLSDEMDGAVSVLVAGHNEEIVTLQERATITTIALTLLIVGLGLGIGLYTSVIISRPIIQLTETAAEIRAGRLETSIDLNSADEIGELAATFNGMVTQLRQTLISLESRSQGLEIIAALSERLSAILSLEALLPELVNQVKEKLAYYHAHIYLLDDTGEKLVVAAGTGAAGAEMKARGHSIPLHTPTSLVARAARTGQIVRVDDVRQAEDWLPNPLLPDTYSEMAVPIVLGVAGEVVGVLDVQQDKIAGLDEGDANLLRSLANQVAVAIRNARLFAEVQLALAEAQTVQEQYITQSWDKDRLARYTTGRVDLHLMPAEAASNGQPPALVAPIKVRDITIGKLRVEDNNPNRAWTENEMALINTVVDQVAQAAENLRLFEQTHERASYEQTVRQITDKLRASPNLDILLETAARELGQHLGVRHTVLELGIERVTDD